MSLETITFENELKKIDQIKVDLLDSNKQLVGFILSDKFLVNFKDFLKLLNHFSNNLVSLGETLRNPMLGLPENPEANPIEKASEKVEEAKKAESILGRGKAFVVAAGIIACAIVTIQMPQLLPPQFLLGVVVLSIVLTFVPNIKDVVQDLFRKEEEEEAELAREDWITESLSLMRDEYKFNFDSIKVQDQSAKTLPDYADSSVDESLYNRAKSAAEQLPFDFLSRIGKIMYACDKSILARRRDIVNAICMAKAASVQQIVKSS